MPRQTVEKRNVHAIFESTIIVYISFTGDNAHARFGREFWVSSFESLESLQEVAGLKKI